MMAAAAAERGAATEHEQLTTGSHKGPRVTSILLQYGPSLAQRIRKTTFAIKRCAPPRIADRTARH